MMGDLQNIEFPPFYVCPIALQIMKDPVTLPTGITYDRDSIEKWLYTTKKNTCPVTNQVLSNIELTPNHNLRRLIQSRCTLNPLSGVETLPTPVSKSVIIKLLKDLNHSNSQIQSLKRLKAIVLENETNKRLMEAVGAVDHLAYILNNHNNNITSSSRPAEEEAIAILYHMHLSQTILQSLLIKSSDFVKTLTRMMQRATNYETRTYAIMLFNSMFAATDSTIQLSPEFFPALVKILTDQISKTATKSALKLLINVCSLGRNRVNLAEASAVPALIEMLLDSYDKRVSEMVLTALDYLCQCAEGRSELMKHGAGLAVVSKKIFRVSPMASDRAVRIVHSVAKYSGNGVAVEMLQVGVVGKLCLVLQVDCGGKMKERAMEVLKMHARVWCNSSCIPQTLISSIIGFGFGF